MWPFKNNTNPNGFFSFKRLWALLAKEFIHMKRDRLTFAMLIGIPLMQLTLFGFAINSNPKHLPTALVMEDYGYFARTVMESFRKTNYFRVIGAPMSRNEANQLMAAGKVQFIFEIPSHFSYELIRGQQPSLLVMADATDPMAASNAMAAANQIPFNLFERDMKGALSYLSPQPPPFQVLVHAKYNPELVSKYTIVPGLMGMVLTMTLVIIAAQVITREKEQGTMESLLATPALPLEVMLGKILPFIIVGYLQISLILLAAFFVFKIPFQGNVLLLFLTALPFIAANLAMGITFSTIAENQLQAGQMAVFFMLPSILLSGFMFPFYGMPNWAQALGYCLPLTYFLRIVRGIILKGNGWHETWPNIWPMLVFMCAAMTAGMIRFRRTLD